MEISKLQYITQDSDQYSHAELVARACTAGADWIQLRMKDRSEKEIEKEAEKVREICSDHNATFILNDYVDIAKRVKADGVHLGKHDVFVQEAREILGNEFIIGGTANTFNDIEQLSEMGADYIGLGPFRFTSTKKNLSPILGLQGYEMLAHLCQVNKIQIPIIAIGGITERDVVDLLKTGISGVAISSAITNAEEPSELIETIIKNFTH